MSGSQKAQPADLIPTTTRLAKRKRKRKDEDNTPQKFQRGEEIALKKIADKKLKGKLKHTERQFREAAQKAAKICDWLLTEESGYLEAEGMERTWQFDQETIVKHAEVGAARKVFDLQLTELGPYSLAFNRSGKHLLIAGAKGHLALMDWQRSQLICEVQVRESTHDVQFLHNEMFFAAAQQKYVYIYDKRGVEVHCLKDATDVRRLEFLPDHFLLCSVGDPGLLRYQDTSTGQVVAQHRTKLGPCSVMRQNPWNGVINLGHANGTVTMWTPNITTPVVKMLCHRGPVRAIALDNSGHHMVTAGADGQVKVWDVRTYRPLHAYFTHSPATNLELSQKGLLAISQGRKVQVWKDALLEKQQAPYMNHSLLQGAVHDIAFCPYEDVLGLGHGSGVSTMLVPGAGEPNFDSFVANPYQSQRERQEQEVVQLLDKLQPETIVLDPDSIAKVVREPAEVQKERHKQADAARQAMLQEQEEKGDKKTKMKGKNRPSKRHRKKQLNIIEEKKPAIQAQLKQQEQEKAQAAKQQEEQEVLAKVPRALHRFYVK